MAELYGRGVTPPPGVCKLNVEASAQTNLGELAVGGIDRDSDGRWIFSFSRKLGWGNIIKAELFAISSAFNVLGTMTFVGL